MALFCSAWCSGALAQEVALDRPVEAADPHAGVPMAAETMETARTLAMGLGARASAANTSAVAVNPAGLSIARQYQVESSAMYEPQASRVSVGGTVTDSFSGPVHAGAHFRYVHGNGYSEHGGFDGRIALAVPIGTALGLGLTGRYMSFWREGEPNVRGPFAEGFTFDAALRVSPVPGLHIAALGHNLLDVGSPLVPRQVGGSLSYTIDTMVTLAFDGLAELGTYRYRNGNIRPEGQFGGALEVFAEGVPIRAGYVYDTGRGQHLLSGGLGYTSPEVGIELSIRQQVNGRQRTWLMSSFRYFVH